MQIRSTLKKIFGLYDDVDLSVQLSLPVHEPIEDELQAQRESWVRGEMAMGSDADEARERETFRRTTNRLETMWQQQFEFMRLLQEKRGFPQFPADITSKKGQQFLKDIRNHLMEELFEAGQHLKNAKSHRATELPEVDREAYKEELVDALHLYFELIIASGVTLDELYDAYVKKGNVNTSRILNGY